MPRALAPALLLALALAGCRAAAAPGPGGAGSGIAELRLADWRPRPMLVTRVTRVARPAFPVVDAHNHLDREGHRQDDVRALVGLLDEAGVRTVVNLDGGFGDQLEAQLDRYDRAFPGRFLTFALLDLRGLDDPGWSRRAAAQLARDFDAGAAGLKIHKTLGLSIRSAKTNRLIPVDDPRFDPIWALCGARGRPVMIHTADPAAFFTPLDRENERWHELREHPEWVFVGKDYPTRDELLAARNRVIARHSGTTFIGAHMAQNAEDLATLARWLDELPNLVIDLDASINELGRQPYAARRFFVTYADRILFGTDHWPALEVYRTYYRWLETADEYFDCGGDFNEQGQWMCYGIFLPRDVLEKIYRGNADRILRGYTRG